MLRIAIDMDEVVNDLMTKYCMVLYRRTGKAYNVEDFKEYDVRKTLPPELHEIGQELFKDKELWDIVSPIYEAQHYIKKLMDLGHKVYFATATEPCAVGWKQEWIEKYFPYFDYKDMIVIHNKGLLDVDILVDDYINNLIAGDYYGILYSRPWNLNVHTENMNVDRADSWRDIYYLIQQRYVEMCEELCLGGEVSNKCLNIECKYLDDDDGGAICRKRYRTS